MGYSNNLVTAPVSTGDIANALGIASNDVGTLCSSASIKPFAKYKPQSYNAIFGGGDKGQLTDAQRLAGNWGIRVVNNSTGQAVSQYTVDELMTSVWRYLARDKYRMLDFIAESSSNNYAGYNSGAPAQLLCPKSMDALSVNAVNELHYESSVRFFVFQKDGHTNLGKDIDGNTVPNRSYCIDLKDLFGDDIYGSAYLGLAVKSGNTWYFIKCTSRFTYVAADGIIDNDMLILNVGDQIGSTPHGFYNAYPCVIAQEGITPGDSISDDSQVISSGNATYKYYPMHHLNGLNQICSIPLSVGGTDLYTIGVIGYSRNGTDAPTSSGTLYVNSDDVYIHIRVTNHCGLEHLTASTRANWILHCAGTGQYIPRSTEVPESINYNKVADTMEESRFQMQNGESRTLTFHFRHIFTTGTVSDAAPGSYVDLTPTMYYNNSEFTDTELQPLVRIELTNSNL